MEDTSHKLRILVVENNVALQGLMRNLLQEMGHQTFVTGSAEAASQLLTAQRYDVLLADIDLPGMSGTELARLAHQESPDIHIVFASAYGYLVTDRCDFHFSLLQKPFHPNQLQQLIEEIAMFSC